MAMSVFEFNTVNIKKAYICPLNLNRLGLTMKKYNKLN